MEHYIYKITNKINGKCYVGRTMQQPSQRWKQHKLGMGDGKLMPIHLALSKYGSDNFDYEVIHTCDENKVIYAEVFYINKYNSLAPYGYNLDFNVSYIKDNPYLITESKESVAVQSIGSEPVKTEYKLPTRARYPFELWSEIKKLYEEGKSPKDIKKELTLDIPERTMNYKLKQLGCNTSCKARNKLRGNKKFFISEEEKNLIVEDFKTGLKTTELEKKYNHANQCIRKILVERGVYVSKDKKICRSL